tara:strand:+ start:547 stop:1017 length:471 start_codon:yes stop_codon:yes gene_type:complete
MILVIYDSIDEHLKLAGEFDKAAIPMGMYLAWALNLGLLRQELVREHQQLITRVRMQDAKGSELLMALGGNLDETLFSERGNRFAGNYYPRYMIDYALVFGRDPYLVEDTWSNYDKIAKFLTKELLGDIPLSTSVVNIVKSGSRTALNLVKSLLGR